MIPSEDMLRLYRLRAMMAIVMIAVAAIMLAICVVHVALTYDPFPLAAALGAIAVSYPTARRLLDPSTIGMGR